MSIRPTYFRRVLILYTNHLIRNPIYTFVIFPYKSSTSLPTSSTYMTSTAYPCKKSHHNHVTNVAASIVSRYELLDGPEFEPR